MRILRVHLAAFFQGVGIAVACPGSAARAIAATASVATIRIVRSSHIDTWKQRAEDGFSMRRVLVGFAAVVVLAGVRTAAWADHSSAIKPSVARSLLLCPGSERWSIKTLTDADAGSVNYSHPLKRTVAQLAAQDPATLTPPVKIGSGTPRLALEKIVYRVKVRLVKAKIEGGTDGDEDIHLVIADAHPPGQPDGQTMIAEFPKAGCAPESGSTKAKQIDRARTDFVAACGMPPTGKPFVYRSTATATITGVGFFDLKHGTPQLGRAPHDRELHPVLKFVISSPCR
jgi:hypothetical protein